MFALKKDKYRNEYIKSHYIIEYVIDDENKKINVYYIDGSSYDYPLTSKALSNIKKIMKEQYYEWGEMVKRIYLLNPIMLLYLNSRLKKQKYYLEHVNQLNNYHIKKGSLKGFSKRERELMDESMRYTHSYFNISSVDKYNLSTMKKINKEILENKCNTGKKLK